MAMREIRPSPVFQVRLAGRVPSTHERRQGRRGWRLARRMTLALGTLAAGAAIACVVCASQWINHEEYAHKVRAILDYRTPQPTRIYDRKGRLLTELWQERYEFTPIERVPKVLVDAVVAIEDRRFWQHRGVDMVSMARALWHHLWRPYSQGASTLTQQLVRRLALSREKSWRRKIEEMILAVQLERRVTKEKILEMYLNVMFLGEGSFGVGAAARTYFGKSVETLSLEEAALLAGLFQAPSRTSPFRDRLAAQKRRNQVLIAMLRHGLVEPGDAAAVQVKPVAVRARAEERGSGVGGPGVAPYYLDYVRQILGQMSRRDARLAGGDDLRGKGWNVVTTLDLDLQRAAEMAIDRAAPRLDRAYSGEQRRRSPSQGRVEASMLVTSVDEGHVLAMVGGRDYGQSQFNRAVSAMRSPGSAFKPVVFAEALARGWRWSDLLYVAPIAINTYRPRTERHEYLRETTLLRALYRSLNGPTVELSQRLGLESIFTRARTLGVESPLKPEAGTALGGSEVTAVDLARMYGTFASGGVRPEIHAILRVEDQDGSVLWSLESQASPQDHDVRRVLDHETAFLMTEGLRAVMRHGTGSSRSSLAPWAVGKTGTSNGARDNWFCGYSRDLVAVAWAGIEGEGEVDRDMTAGDLTLPIWADFMEASLNLLGRHPWPTPAGIVWRSVDAELGHERAGAVNMAFRIAALPRQDAGGLEWVRRMGGSTRGIHDTASQ